MTSLINRAKPLSKERLRDCLSQEQRTLGNQRKVCLEKEAPCTVVISPTHFVRECFST